MPKWSYPQADHTAFDTVEHRGALRDALASSNGA